MKLFACCRECWEDLLQIVNEPTRDLKGVMTDRSQRRVRWMRLSLSFIAVFEQGMNWPRGVVQCCP